MIILKKIQSAYLDNYLGFSKKIIISLFKDGTKFLLINFSHMNNTVNSSNTFNYFNIFNVEEFIDVMDIEPFIIFK